MPRICGTVWWLAGGAAGQMPRVILDPVAVADLLHHLQIEHRPLMQALRFQELALRFELGATEDELVLDAGDGELHPIARGDEVRLRVDGELVVLS
jgi:hypothetical protein